MKNTFFICWYYLRWADLQRDPLHSVWAQRPVFHLSVLPAGWSVRRWVHPRKAEHMFVSKQLQFTFFNYISGSSDNVWKVSRAVVNRQRIITWTCEFPLVVPAVQQQLYCFDLSSFSESCVFPAGRSAGAFVPFETIKKDLKDRGFRLGSRVMCGDLQNF